MNYAMVCRALKIVSDDYISRLLEPHSIWNYQGHGNTVLWGDVNVSTLDLKDVPNQSEINEELLIMRIIAAVHYSLGYALYGVERYGILWTKISGFENLTKHGQCNWLVNVISFWFARFSVTLTYWITYFGDE